MNLSVWDGDGEFSERAFVDIVPNVVATGRGRAVYGVPDVRAQSDGRRNPSQGDACLIDPVDQNRETNCVGRFEAVWDNAPRQRMK